jgi:hypothetical protein
LKPDPISVLLDLPRLPLDVSAEVHKYIPAYLRNGSKLFPLVPFRFPFHSYCRSSREAVVLHDGGGLLALPFRASPQPQGSTAHRRLLLQFSGRGVWDSDIGMQVLDDVHIRNNFFPSFLLLSPRTGLGIIELQPHLLIALAAELLASWAINHVMWPAN